MSTRSAARCEHEARRLTLAIASFASPSGAWPYLEEHLGTLTPGERLFRGLDRWAVGAAHRDRLKALGLPHHRLHDARHFYAIRAVRAGTPYDLVGRQLGHADVQMVARIYG